MNECKNNNTRLIFKGSGQGCLIDITICSQSVDHIVEVVTGSDWNINQVMNFLNEESQKNAMPSV